VQISNKGNTQQIQIFQNNPDNQDKQDTQKSEDQKKMQQKMRMPQRRVERVMISFNNQIAKQIPNFQVNARISSIIFETESEYTLSQENQSFVFGRKNS